MPFVDHEVIIKIAADFARGFERRGDSEAFVVLPRAVVRQHAHLNIARDAQFALNALIGARGFGQLMNVSA